MCLNNKKRDFINSYPSFADINIFLGLNEKDINKKNLDAGSIFDAGEVSGGYFCKRITH